VINKAGAEIAGKLLISGRECAPLTDYQRQFPLSVCGIPGGISKGLKKEEAAMIRSVARM